jgi:Zn-dependent peptidase ImmA (M78 family)/HJR/Mrr/RecB family endonuclease/DNA-binding XRE family transcriptional regulator
MSRGGQTKRSVERFNPTRLDLARRRRGFTKTKLAREAGVSTRILTAYESGDREPTDATLQRLATSLDFPSEFFAGDDLEEPLLDGVSFRALSGMTARQRDQATGSAAIAIQLDQWVRRRFDIPAANVPRLRHEEPEAAAEAVRVEWGLGQRRAPNMVHLLESNGVRVFSLVQECAEVDAFSFWHHGVPYVFLNSVKSAERSRMDAAHELGHLVLHFWGAPGGRDAEEQAQAFGAAFLMPARSVLADAPRHATVPQIIKAKRHWNVAAMNLAYRMAKLKLLTEWQARSAYIQLGRMGYRSDEPGGIPRETSQVWTKVFDALREEGMTRAEVARQLSITVDELNGAVFGLVLAKFDVTRPHTAIPPQIEPLKHPKLYAVTDKLSRPQRPNLMALSPEEFESLISHLVKQVGLEPHQMQSSRDGGVDFVARDPRPVFGGKVIIQAKRYTKRVGVSPVRDLFGTMHSERASKGIFVTTSDYGKAAYEFADDKPLELISGHHLLRLLKEHVGLDAHIEPADNWVDPVLPSNDLPLNT